MTVGAETGAAPPTRDGRPRLLQQVRSALRARHYSRATERAYVLWVRRLVRFHGLRHPEELGPSAVTAFLTDLAERGRVSESTQTQGRRGRWHRGAVAGSAGAEGSGGGDQLALVVGVSCGPPVRPPWKGECQAVAHASPSDGDPACRDQ
jgi:hypothetical protein